ncbi:MAG: cation-transporting P-type ATPase, partial [Arenicellales bacterium]|nr:cation-transporting P-type ATPase [Arenicellales bacterium]
SGLTGAGVEDVQQQERRPWHVMPLKDVLSQLNSAENNGLSTKEAGVRLRAYGRNELQATEKRSDLLILVGQFNSLPVGLLGVSAVVSLITGGALDAAVILGVVVINAAIGFVTERQAEKTIRSLAETGARLAHVYRSGEIIEIPLEDIVPGDLLQLSPGSYVAADVRLVHSHRLSVDESALTGESLPVTKDYESIAGEDTPLGDRINMAFMGTHVTGGNGRGVVVATAKATELGQIQTMVGEAESPETPMQKQLDKMGTQLALLSGGVCAGVFAVGIVRGFAWLEMLKSSVSLAVAAVPEGLPAVATTTLAMGIKDMRSRNVAVRHLDAVETLGSVQVFCLDKTGTLTLNRMAVVSVHSGDATFSVTEGVFVRMGESVDAMACEELVRLMQVVSLCSETVIIAADEAKIEGSATETALVEMSINAGIDVQALRDQYPTLKTRYRAEGRPFMSTLHTSTDGKHLLAVKGSPEEVLALSDYYLKDGKPVRLTEAVRQNIMAENERMAGDALRVLGAAYKDLKSAQMPKKTDHLIWLGLTGMADPMRTGMDELMAHYQHAGIKTVMITGDQSATAQAIGRQLGLSEGRPLKVLESGALEDIDSTLLAGLVKDVHVFARVSPAHKLKIVRALQDAGNVVAMTGDGINDGPALKAADIGVAMGGTGTDVAREVSDVVLEDDNLHTMEVAVRQGRTIYNNIRKTIHFMVSTNLTEIEVMLAGIAAGVGQPMNPMQLLWINLVTDIFPGLALSMEPAEPDVMDRPPRDPDEPIISGSDLKRMIFESGTIGVGTMAAYLYGRNRYGIGAPQAATMAFTSLTVNELAHALSSRSHYRTVFSKDKLPPNRYLNKAIIGMLGAQALATWVPGVRRLLGTAPLGIIDFAVVAVSVLVPFVVNEFTKPERPAALALTDEQTSEDEVGDEITLNQTKSQEAA